MNEKNKTELQLNNCKLNEPMTIICLKKVGNNAVCDLRNNEVNLLIPKPNMKKVLAIII